MSYKKITKFLLTVGLIAAFSTSYGQANRTSGKDTDGDGVKTEKMNARPHLQG